MVNDSPGAILFRDDTRPEQQRKGKGGEENGPAMQLAEHSLAKALSITLGCV